jgi:N-acetylglucosaminyldiphosphoundecaprenol N-acetyl-beta-D-mannosaminyltransferase
MEKITIGPLHCDLLRTDEFWDICRRWLASDSFHHIVTLNPEMIMAAQTDNAFFEALKKADLKVADGAGIIWARWYMRSSFWPLLPSLISFMWRDVERITGVDIVIHLAQLAQEAGLPLYLLGGAPPDVARTAEILRRRFPRLQVFKAHDHTFDIEGPTDIIEDIRQRQAAIVLVAYGASRQAQWIEYWRGQLPSVRIAVGVGGAFAILGESLPRAPLWLRQHNLEWLWRLLLEPQRLPRIWQATVRFPLYIRALRQKSLAH